MLLVTLALALLPRTSGYVLAPCAAARSPDGAQGRARAARLAALAVTPSTPPPPVNACVAAPSALGWLPNEAFDAAVSFGGL